MTRPSPLTEPEIADWLSSHLRWKIEGGQLVCDVELSYDDAIDVLAATREMVGRLNHHPVSTVEYRRLRVELSTHDVGAVTSLDLQLAEGFDAAIDARTS